MEHFRDYQTDGVSWITLATGEYYPDVLPDACHLYAPVQVLFGQLLEQSESSEVLFRNICDLTETWMRVQLCRIFRKYVAPPLPVEMLKQKSKVDKICQDSSDQFRPVNEVHFRFKSRPCPDEVLCALLWEYKDRGKKGYDLTERFFDLVKSRLPEYSIVGPKRAGSDIRLGDVWPDYPKPDRPVDFLIKRNGEVKVVGQARYDGDRGGAQEDDRTGGYRDFANEILMYANNCGLDQLKLTFVNDGPGLLLGSMWSDYASLEDLTGGRGKVMTLRMVPDRLTEDWIES